MGRKRLTEKLSISLQDIQTAYEQLGNLPEVAKKYECSERTIRKYLDLGGVKRKRGPKASVGLGAATECGCLPSWIRDHSSEPLPHSIRKISQLTGCSENETKSYLYRKRNQMRSMLSGISDLRKANLILPTLQGYKVPTRAFSAYKLYLNKWAFTVKIKAWLKPGNKQVEIEIPFSDLISKMKLVNQLVIPAGVGSAWADPEKI